LILRSTDALKVLGNVTFSLLDHEKRRASQVEIHERIASVIQTFRPFLQERAVEIVMNFAPGNPYLRGSKAAVESVITNFLNNSLVWFEQVHAKGYKIAIRTEISNGNLRLHFADNGPGIKGIDVNDVWLPGEASHPEDLTQKELAPNCLLMSDLLSHWHVDDSWSYNHGRRSGINMDPGPPAFSGLNQLYGDGRVVWKSVKRFDVPNLNPGNNAIGVIRAYSTDSTYY